LAILRHTHTALLRVRILTSMAAAASRRIALAARLARRLDDHTALPARTLATSCTLPDRSLATSCTLPDRSLATGGYIIRRDVRLGCGALIIP
jgi:hypothetical protein